MPVTTCCNQCMFLINHGNSPVRGWPRVAVRQDKLAILRSTRGDGHVLENNVEAIVGCESLEGGDEIAVLKLSRHI